MSHAQLGPWRLQPDNFTPPSRTPWGGRTIVDRIKRELALAPERRAYAVVGESWEVSVEPSFPSRIVNLPGQPSLSEHIAEAPEAALGEALVREFAGCSLLVKLLDAAQPLSVQVHPGHDEASLAAHESGKPEAWLIVDAAPGAGLYLGLAEGVTREGLERALRAGDDLTSMLNFVPVVAGDCFELAAGLVHAIGAGVTLVEPQQVLPGRQGVTYRFWDWGRRYDRAGQLDPNGEPRELHIAQSLAATDFDGLRGEALVGSLRRHPRRAPAGPAVFRDALIDGPYFRVQSLRGTGRLDLDVERLTALVVVEGRLGCNAGSGFEAFRGGESLVIPACARHVELDLDNSWVVLAQP